jgi:hypothetical protein
MLLLVRSRHRYPLWSIEYPRKIQLVDQGCQFLRGFGREIRIAGTTEHAQVLVGGGDSMDGEV